MTPFKEEKETEEEREDGEGDAAADGLTAGRRDEELQRLFGRYKEEEQRHSAQHKSGIVQRTMTTAPTARQGRPPPDDKLSMPADGLVEDQLEDSAVSCSITPLCCRLSVSAVAQLLFCTLLLQLEFLHHRPTGSSVVSSPHAPKDSRTTAIVDDVTETDF